MNTSSFAAALCLLVALAPAVSSQDIVSNLRSTNAADTSVSHSHAEHDPVAVHSSAMEEANSIQTERLLGGATKEACGDCVCLNKNGAPMQKWCSTAGSGPYFHENYRYKKGTSSVKTNEISIFEFLENAMDVDLVTVRDSGVTTATLATRFTCLPSGSTGWRVGLGSKGNAPCSEDSYGKFDVEWVVIDDIGWMMTFTLAVADTAYGGATGVVKTLFKGQNEWYDTGNAVAGWCLAGASGHLQVAAHEVVNISGEDCNTEGFSFSWDHNFNKSGGNMELPEDGKTVIKMGQSFNNVGYATTNCGPNSMATPGGQIIWTVNDATLLDSLNDGILCPASGPPAPAAAAAAEEELAQEVVESSTSLFEGSV